MKNLSVLFFGFLLFGCAHRHIKGSVVMVHSPDEVDVCLGEDEVKVGDTVGVFKSVCTQGGNRRSASVPRCEKVKITDGVVTQVTEHFSTLKPTEKASINVGYIVEKP